MEGQQYKKITIRIPIDLYEKIARLAGEKNTSISAIAAQILSEYLEKKQPEATMPESTAETPVEQGAGADEVLNEKLWKKIERYLQDELNKAMAPLEEFKNRVVELYNKVDELSARLSAIEQQSTAPSRRAQRRQRGRRTAIDILKDEKVLFEAELRPSVDKKRLFSYFERMGVVVLNLGGMRVAIDPDYWRFFLGKAETVTSKSEEEIAQVLGKEGAALLKLLESDGKAVYDDKEKKWVLKL